jgi:hypothetical protein
MNETLELSQVPHCESCGAHFYGETIVEAQEHVFKANRLLNEYFGTTDHVYVSMTTIMNPIAKCCKSPSLRYGYYLSVR